MTTAARPGSFTGATDNSANGGLFGDTKIDGIPDIVGADVLAAQTSATNAKTSETNAATSAATATTQASTATAQASAASTSAGESLASKNASATSAGESLASKNAAATSETNAGTSQTQAAASQLAAAQSATSASTSASTATTKADDATTQAAAAATSATQAANSFDDFDDRYLGQKSSDPSVDNDGNALLTGALYFNTSSNVLKIYNGSAWQQSTPTNSEQTNINTLAQSAVVADMALLANSPVIDDMAILASAATVADMAILATNDVVADMNTLGTADVVADMNTLGTADVVADMNTLGTADVVSDMNTLATAAIVEDMNLLATSSNVTNMATLGASGVVGNIATVSTNINNVNTTASNITGVNSFAERYRVASSDPGSNNDAGDLYFNTTNNELRNYNGSNWQPSGPSGQSQTNINIVAGDIVAQEDLGSITEAINTSSGSDIDTVADSITNVDTTAGSIANVNTVAANITDVQNVGSTIAGTVTFAITIASVGGSNVYVVDGVNKPILTLKRGFIYTFDQSNSSNTSHPLRFKTAAGGSSYSTGVVATGTPGQAGAKVVLTVASDAPDSLIYYCTVHGEGMGNSIVVNDNSIEEIADNITGINNFGARYRVAGSAPTSSLDEGDLYYDTNANSLNYYNGSSWIPVVAGAMTSLVVDTSPQLGGNLDVNGNQIVSASNGHIVISPNGSGLIKLIGSVDTTNLTMDFGSVA